MDSLNTLTIDDLDFDFENSPLKLVATRSLPEVKMVGLSVGPFQEGTKFKANYWVARELVEAGIARLDDGELLSLVTLTKIQWGETIQTGALISKREVPEHFYPKLRRYLTRLKEGMRTNTSLSVEYSQALKLANDIVDSRSKKVTRLAATPPSTEAALAGILEEERILYDCLRMAIAEWRSEILKPSAP